MAKRKSHTFDAGELQDFYAEFDNSRRELNDLNSAHGHILKRLEKQGYNREAFKIVAKWDQYDIGKLQDVWRALNQYADVLGLKKKIDSQGDIVDMAEGKEAEAAA